ncbi:MAG: cell division protein FtsZ [Pseudomonadota bacterium]
MPLIELEDDAPTQAKIKVIGVGGGGGNAINTMIASGLEGVDFIAANTDLQALDSNLAPIKVQLGCELTKGLGAGADPSLGREAAIEDTNKIVEAIEGADMVFVTAGMGGGTGTGAAPVIAKAAKELGALTVGVVTKPFRFEGKKRMRQAEEGIVLLEDDVDTLITIPNERLLSVAGQATTMLDAFRKVDDVLLNAVQGISDLVIIHGFINVDFADVRAVMGERGHALMGSGQAMGDRKALEAAKQAINSPLLEDINIEGATGLLINITGGPDLTLSEIHEAASLIQEAAHEDANIIFGSVVDASMEDQVRITVIATGFDKPARQMRAVNTMRSRPQTITTVQPQRETRPVVKEEPAYVAVGSVSTASAEVNGAHVPEVRVASTPKMQEPLQVTPGNTASFLEENGQKIERPKRKSGNVPAPRFHSELNIPDEQEMDIPAFLRRQPSVNID